MEKPKVSVIIPVYKAETTIRKCLDSFLNQTLNEWEIVLVDDGSPDSSGQICDEYAIKDNRFRVIHQTNAGVSAARQVGLESVTGDYVIHADPDDWVEPKMLEDLYAKAMAEDADMVICDMYKDFGNRCIYFKQAVTDTNPQKVLEDIFKGNIHGSCCNKLIRHSFIKKQHAFFPERINYCEDVCFNVQLLSNNIKIYYLDKAYYHYVLYSSSITNHFTIEKYKEIKDYINFISKYLPESSYPVIRSKEWLKKEAFRTQIIRFKDLNELYPEIRKATGEHFFQSIMYYLAFNGYRVPSMLLLSIYLFKMKLLRK